MIKVLLSVYVGLSLLVIAALSAELYRTNKEVEQMMFNSFILPKNGWTCALEFVPHDDPTNRQCVALMDKRIAKQ